MNGEDAAIIMYLFALGVAGVYPMMAVLSTHVVCVPVSPGQSVPAPAKTAYAPFAALNAKRATNKLIDQLVLVCLALWSSYVAFTAQSRISFHDSLKTFLTMAVLAAISNGIGTIMVYFRAKRVATATQRLDTLASAKVLIFNWTTTWGAAVSYVYGLTLDGWDIFFFLGLALVLVFLKVKGSQILLKKLQVVLDPESHLAKGINDLKARFNLPASDPIWVASTVPNAIALGKGQIYLFAGLKGRLSDDEIVAILAHELAHIERKDVPKLQNRMRALLLVAAFIVFGLAFTMTRVNPGGVAFVPFAALMTFFALMPLLRISYGQLSRGFEYACDARAAQMVGAQLFGSALSKIALGLSQPLQWPSGNAYNITHPALEDRLSRIGYVWPSEELSKPEPAQPEPGNL